MNAQDELNPEDRRDVNAATSNEPVEAAANADVAVETPPHDAETPAAPQVENKAYEGAPKVELPPRLNLIPYPPSTPRPEAAPAAPRSLGMSRWISGVAAGLALVAGITAIGLYDHTRQSTILAANAEESTTLAQTVKSLKERIDAMEAARSRDESADLHKVAAEIKAERDAARDLNTALAQLTARVDRVDHDQSARLDKLADRIDHESAARLTDLAARVEKLEKRPAAPVVATVTPPVAPPAVVTPPKPGLAALPAPKPDVVVSNEITGSIDKPKPMLHSYRLVDVQGDYALVDGRDGPQQVGPGDVLPGAGRVLRVERHGRDWVLVTSLGLISGDQSRF